MGSQQQIYTLYHRYFVPCLILCYMLYALCQLRGVCKQWTGLDYWTTLTFDLKFEHALTSNLNMFCILIV